MNYNQFTKSLKRSDVVESVRSYMRLIEKTSEDKVLVDGEETEFVTIEEAKQYIKEKHLSKKLEQEISNELYEEISEHTLANIIKEHHDVKVTDTLIENYIQLASSRMFSTDPVIQEIRKLNKLDTLVEGKLHYVLDDDNIIAISETTQERLNNLLQNQTEVVQYMRESKENFMHVLELIEE
jgi:hypothetical protein